MADGISASISGLEGIFGAIDEMGNRIRSDSQMAMFDALQFTFDQSQADCPVLSGELKSSGAMEVGDQSGSVSYSSDHALFVEEGHHTRSGSWVEGRHFLLNAFEEGSKKFMDGLEGKLG